MPKDETVALTYDEQVDIIAKLELLSNADIESEVMLEPPAATYDNYRDLDAVSQVHRTRHTKLNLVPSGLARSLQYFLEVAWGVNRDHVRDRKRTLTERTNESHSEEEGE